MAAVIPEAADAVSSGTAAVRGASTKQRVKREARQRVKGAASSGGRTLYRARVPGNRHYQPAILAEFLVAILVTAVGPIAQGGDKTAQAKGGPSPYSSDTLKQLIAIGAAYFLLAILSGSQKYGRLAAWFGGLVLLAVGLNSFVSGGLMAIFGIFGPNPLAPNANTAELGTDSGPTASQIAQTTLNAFGQETPGQQQAASQLYVNFNQPGVATTTETSPGVSVQQGTGIIATGGNGVPVTGPRGTG